METPRRRYLSSPPPPSPSFLSDIQSKIRAAVDKVAPMTAREKQRALATVSLSRGGPSPWNGPKHVYAGTVPHKVKVARRKADHRAKLARRANRR